MSNPLLEAALSYASRGWPVLPLHGWIGRCTCGDGQCGSPAKHPRTAHGLKDASLDPVKISAWWAEWPNSNVGVRCDQLCVLDIDGPGGAIALQEHALDPDLHPCTSQTGVGRHLLFQAVAGVRPKTRVLPDVDVRAGEGSYIVAPPSTHWTGAVYEWKADGAPPLLTLATIRSLLGAEEPPSAGSTVRDPGPSAPSTNGRYGTVTEAVQAARAQGLLGVSEGGRHDALLRLVGRELAIGLFTLPELVAHAIGWARGCSPPMPEAEALRVVYDLWKGEAAKHGGDPTFDYGDGRKGGGLELEVVDIDELRSLKPVSWAIEGLVPIGLNVVYAEPNIGKSLLVQSWMFASSAEQDWHSRKTRAGGAVLLVGEGRRGLWKRVAAWDQSSPGSRRKHKIRVGSLPDLSDAGERRKLEELVKRERPAWLGIDTLIDATGNADENSSTEMKLVLLFLSRLAEEYDVAVVLVHHANKDQMKQGFNRVRGTTAIVGKAEAVFALQHDPGGGVCLVCEKQRDDERAKPVNLRLLTVELAEGGRGVVLVPDAERSATANAGTPGVILELLELAGSDGATVAQLVVGTGVDRTNVQRAIAGLVASGLVMRQRISKVGLQRFWLSKYAPPGCMPAPPTTPD